MARKTENMVVQVAKNKKRHSARTSVTNVLVFKSWNTYAVTDLALNLVESTPNEFYINGVIEYLLN